MNKRPVIAGIIATDALLTLFVLFVAIISGWETVQSQFAHYWYYLVPLAIGFGVQVGLFIHLKDIVRQGLSKRMVAVTGGTSTAAMVSCCTHYLVNIIPVIGLSGVSAFVGRYQVPIFWLGLAFNLAGIAFLVRRVMLARRQLQASSINRIRPTPATNPLINNWTVLGSFAVLVALVWFFSNSPKPSAVASTTGQTISTADTNSLTKTDIQNGMTVAVTPKANPDGTWDFTVQIDNHAVNIMEDMVAVSSVTDRTGQSLKPTAWTGDPPGGHHRSGILKFGAMAPGPVRLTIRELGGVAERTLSWDNLVS